VPLADRSCDCSHRPGQTDTGSSSLFFFNDTATTEIYTTTDTLSLLDALPISHEPEQRHRRSSRPRGWRATPPVARAAPLTSSRPFPQPDPSPQSPSSVTSPHRRPASRAGCPCHVGRRPPLLHVRLGEPLRR